MADWNDKSIKLGDYKFFLILLSHMLITFVDGRGVDQFMKKRELPMHEGTVKTIESEDGDVIDCVDIRKQPAFNHPLLKNHTVQIKPHAQSRGIDEAENNPNMLFQSWHKNGECPEGTVPLLRRTQNFNHSRRSYPAFLHKKVAQLNDVNNPSNHESDGYQSTGCYNLDCPGFVQTNKNIALGGSIEPVSKYGGEQRDISIVIHKARSNSYSHSHFNNNDGNWWLQVQDQLVGYWPSSIFTHLAGTSDAISWGGEIVNNQPNGHHTSTQMGSGHFPNEAYGKASYFTKLGYFDEGNNVKDPENLEPFVTRPPCYDLRTGKDNKFGVFFYFGGPGYSANCQ
ncbi:NEP-interacting protein 1 [Citrus sinensis]|uniref:NEP-interacting protein 1 n=1 Tax=Citrus sinensis TaxID=2711 RepID=A0ACB8J7B1_CITSI|nr:NEP-interacting protein 1 [Citrus sinensis]